MEFDFEQLVAALNVFPPSADVLRQITLLLEEQTHKPYHALLALEQWAWQLLGRNAHRWIHKPNYQELLFTLASLNKNLIFSDMDMTPDDKAALLFPVTVHQINRIFKQIESTSDDNDPYITIASLWFDNHAYFVNHNPDCTALAITDHIDQYMVHIYMMSEQYKFYLTELQRSPLTESLFTAKMLFYIKTSTFSSYCCMAMGVHSFPRTFDEVLPLIQDDYLRIVHIHSRTVASWSRELLTCLAHLIAYVCHSYRWDKQKRTELNTLLTTDKMVCDHVQDLIDIIAYEPLQNQMKTARSNDETILINSSVVFLMIIAQTQNVNWFFRGSSTIQSVLSSLAERSIFDEVCICTYGLLAGVLADEQLKNLKIADKIGGFFYNMLQCAWHHPSKKYKQIPIEYLLRGFCNLAKHDFIQQSTADSNIIPFLIEISEQYPILYDTLWALSFNKDIQQQLRASSTFMSKLSHLAKESDNEQMQKTTHGLLWNLKIDHEDRASSEMKEDTVFDIMISYSHKDKDLCRQLYQELIKVGYRVWIDFDQAHGNVMDAMAQAIERSQTVIICISEEYRRSNYCRAEAQYAFQRQRKIVPVLFQKHYKSDGWLLFLIGQLLYVDFTKHEFSRAMEMLLKELRTSDSLAAIFVTSLHKEDVHISLPVQSIESQEASISLVLPKKMVDWTHVDVQNWLVGHKLIQLARLLADCDGQSLVHLSKYIKHSGMEYILHSFREDALRRLNENLSLIELSCFQTVLDRHDSE